MTMTEQRRAGSLETQGLRGSWHWWGVAAGVLGLVGHLITDPQGSLTPADRQLGQDVVELVERGPYHVGAVAGYLAIGCLLVLAAGYRRWSDGLRPDVLAARVLPAALVASVGAMIVGYGFKGMMAIYLPGGLNQNEYPLSGLYSLFMINDLAPFFAWWGVAIAAAAAAWLGLRDRVLPLWIGIVSALAALAPLVFLAVTGLTGFAGVPTPLWLIIISLGLVFGKRAA